MIEISHLVKKYGDHIAVNDLTLTVEPGKIYGFLGPNGAGKTTTFYMIIGIERPTQGQIYLSEVNVTNMPMHKRAELGISYLAQESSIFRKLTVEDNLKAILETTSLSKKEQHQKMDDLIEEFGLENVRKRKGTQLSGGERRRAEIARCLSLEPQFILLDEPLAALDLKRKQEILPYLERLHDELDIPLLYVSHSPDEVARLADYLVAMEAGRALACGPLADTLARLDLPIRLGEDAGAILDATIGAVDARWHLARVDFSGGSLWVRDQGLPVGRRVRVRVLARDVSLAEEPGTSSIQNVLRGCVDAVGDDGHPGLALVRVRVGDAMLLARLTKRSAASLGVAPGRTLWVQMKSVALME